MNRRLSAVSPGSDCGKRSKFVLRTSVGQHRQSDDQLRLAPAIPRPSHPHRGLPASHVAPAGRTSCAAAARCCIRSSKGRTHAYGRPPFLEPGHTAPGVRPPAPRFDCAGARCGVPRERLQPVVELHTAARYLRRITVRQSRCSASGTKLLHQTFRIRKVSLRWSVPDRLASARMRRFDLQYLSQRLPDRSPILRGSIPSPLRQLRSTSQIWRPWPDDLRRRLQKDCARRDLCPRCAPGELAKSASFDKSQI
jgi:hypothetical protein